MPTKKWTIEVKEEQLQIVPINSKDGRAPVCYPRCTPVLRHNQSYNHQKI